MVKGERWKLVKVHLSSTYTWLQSAIFYWVKTWFFKRKFELSSVMFDTWIFVQAYVFFLIPRVYNAILIIVPIRNVNSHCLSCKSILFPQKIHKRKGTHTYLFLTSKFNNWNKSFSKYIFCWNEANLKHSQLTSKY